MVSVASRYFEGVGFRGMFNVKNAMRFTLMKFDDREEAELYTLALLMRFRAIWGEVAIPGG